MAYTIRQYSTKSGKRYEVRYRKPDGSSTGRRGFKRKMDADAWGAANVTTAKSVGAYIDPQAGRRLVEDFWEPWLAAKKTKAKPSYIKSLEDAWRVHVEPQWGMREMQSITRDEVQRWVTDLAGRRSASVTIRAENLLRSLMERQRPIGASTTIHATASSCRASRCGSMSICRPMNCLVWRCSVAGVSYRAHSRTVRHALGRTRRPARGGR